MLRFTLITSSVESSSTCTTSRSDGHDSPHTAPIDSWYTCTHTQPRARRQCKVKSKSTRTEPELLPPSSATMAARRRRRRNVGGEVEKAVTSMYAPRAR